jgi:hypothetical protein
MLALHWPMPDPLRITLALSRKRRIFMRTTSSGVTAGCAKTPVSFGEIDTLCQAGRGLERCDLKIFAEQKN